MKFGLYGNTRCSSGAWTEWCRYHGNPSAGRGSSLEPRDGSAPSDEVLLGHPEPPHGPTDTTPRSDPQILLESEQRSHIRAGPKRSRNLLSIESVSDQSRVDEGSAPCGGGINGGSSAGTEPFSHHPGPRTANANANAKQSQQARLPSGHLQRIPSIAGSSRRELTAVTVTE